MKADPYPLKPSLWKAILKTNFTRWERLADYLELTNEQRAQLIAPRHFVLNLPMRLARKVEKGTLDDPILKQFLPTRAEQVHSAGFVSDPVGDRAKCVSGRLIHKYAGRALLVCTGACAMHCRFCFRQHYDYAFGDKSFEEELELIRADTSLREIILSGGDPLSLDDHVLHRLLDGLSAIPHVRQLRFHTRFPIGIPERIDESFLRLIANVPKTIWFVIHCNHSKELDEEVIARLTRLRRSGVILLNQSVLLKAVNDDVSVLKQLSETLVEHGIAPYYLHQMDRVQGAAHFEVSEEEGKELVKALEKLLPGYAVPKYVREIAGEPAKSPL